MAEEKIYDSDYLAYMNEMADILSHCDGGQNYSWHDPEAMEKRLLEGHAPVKVAPTKQTPSQPASPKPTIEMTGLLGSGKFKYLSE